jgi:hypothetical protein
MDKTELRALALDEKERRRRVQRDYELADDGPVAPRVTVSAAVVADSPFTAEMYKLAKESTVKELMLPWIAPERSTVLLSRAQHGYFAQLLIAIDGGTISTPEKIKNADWPA